jgi:acyl-CoA synthetase (AMP-forming)/AMP-acid ligase II
VGLVYQVDDPLGFMTSFYGCLLAGVIPVPIEPPPGKDVSDFSGRSREGSRVSRHPFSNSQIMQECRIFKISGGACPKTP